MSHQPSEINQSETSFKQEMFNEYYNQKLTYKPKPELRSIKRVDVDLNTCKKIHIIGVCGTAMGTLAFMLRDSGFEVTGSDISFWPPMGPLLKSKGVKILEGWDASHIADDVDLVIVGNACAPDHIEVVEALRKNKPLMSMPELMGSYYVGEDKESLVVAGTHGKTTTTGLLSYMLKELNLDPTFLIGGVMQSKRNNGGVIIEEGTSHRVGKGKYVVFEGDEYDTAFFDARPKFLHYRPSSTIITSVEWDHVDIYPDVQTYTKAFEHLISVTQKNLIISNTYPLLSKLSQSVDTKAKVIVYGVDATADAYPIFKDILPQGQRFELIYKGQSLGDFITPMYGSYNTLNTVAVLLLLMKLGVDLKNDSIHIQVRNALLSFPGMKRRQEIVYVQSDKNIILIDDFAHHPTAVAETLKGIKTRFFGRRVVALFEPRSSTSRRKIFEATYPDALSQADVVGIKAPPFKPEVDSIQDILNPVIVQEAILKAGIPTYIATDVLGLVDQIMPHIKNDDVIVVMSNGSFDGILDILKEKIAIL